MRRHERSACACTAQDVFQRACMLSVKVRPANNGHGFGSWNTCILYECVTMEPRRVASPLVVIKAVHKINWQDDNARRSTTDPCELPPKL